MGVYQTQTNFTAGELSPLLDLRFDFNKYANGVRYLENYIVLPQGGVRRRPGTRYVAEAKDSTKAVRLIPFEFSTEQAYILEFGERYIRFYMNAGQIYIPTTTIPLEVATPYAEADLFDIKFAQSADVLYLVHPNYPPYRLSRFSHTNWTLEPVKFLDGPYLPQNKNASQLLTSSLGVVPATPSVTAVADNGAGLIRLTAVAHGLSTGYVIQVDGVLSTTNANGAWTVTVIDPDTIDLDGSVFASSAGAGGYITRLSNVTATGFVPFSPGHVDSLWRINLGSDWGYVQIKRVDSGTSVWARLYADVQTSATSEWREGSWSGVRGYPTAVTFFEQRLMFAGSRFQPQTVWGSATSDYEDMTPGTDDDEAVAYTLASNQVNLIRWLSSGDDLLIGTVGGEFVMFGGNDSALTPSNVTVRRKSTHGSSGAAPVAISNAAIFIQRAGRKIREFGASDTGQYQAPDLTLFAEHITSPSIVQMDYQQEPDSLIWVVREDGVMLTITYIPTQEVIAFSRQITDGLFESVAVIPHPDTLSDQVWCVVQRNINGAVKRYIEYFDPHVYVDSTSSYQGPATMSITGLTHLNGETVTLNCDCAAAFPTQEVVAGTVTFATPVESIMVGLPFTPLIHLNRPEVKLQNGTSQGRKKRWVELNVRVIETLGLTINDEFYYHRTPGDPMDSAPQLYTGDIRVSNSGWDNDGEVVITQTQPFSSTILGIFGLIDVDTTSE